RLLQLIRTCYDQLYKPDKKNLEAVHTDGVERIKQLSVQQLNEIINFDKRSANEDEFPETVIIVPSYYHQQESVFSYHSERDVVICVAGVGRIEEIMGEANTEEKVIEFARALSDSKRIGIIRELGQSPRYG